MIGILYRLLLHYFYYGLNYQTLDYTLSGGKFWSDSERLLLILSSRDMVPEVSKLMGRPLKEVQVKYDQLQEIFKKLYEVKALRHVELGLTLDRAFEKIALEEEIDIKRIREMES